MKWPQPTYVIVNQINRFYVEMWRQVLVVLYFDHLSDRSVPWKWNTIQNVLTQLQRVLKCLLIPSSNTTRKLGSPPPAPHVDMTHPIVNRGKVCIRTEAAMWGNVLLYIIISGCMLISHYITDWEMPYSNTFFFLDDAPAVVGALLEWRYFIFI